jgi:Fis family transcriptional regulator
MVGIVQTQNEIKPLCHSVAECMDEYFRTLNGHAPTDLYDVVLGQVEPPLLVAALRYCAGNQSRAAELLGMNRATLRKKMTQYAIDTPAAGQSSNSHSSNNISSHGAGSHSASIQALGVHSVAGGR